jgi:hypothetical protein
MPKRPRKSTRRKQKRRNKTQRKKGGNQQTWEVKQIDWTDLDEAYIAYCKSTNMTPVTQYVTNKFNLSDKVIWVSGLLTSFTKSYTELKADITFTGSEPSQYQQFHIVSAFLIIYMYKYPAALLNDTMFASSPDTSVDQTTEVQNTKILALVNTNVVDFQTKNKLSSIFGDTVQETTGIPKFNVIFSSLLTNIYNSKIAGIASAIGINIKGDMTIYFKPQVLGITPQTVINP